MSPQPPTNHDPTSKARLERKVPPEVSAGDLLTGDEINVLVTDHLTPGRDGTQLVRAPRSLLLALPALIVSGYAKLGGVAPDLRRLAKPFRKADLRAALVELL